MLADPRATRALVDNFAAQWLNLRRVREVVVHPEFYPDFDESLLEAFIEETRLFLGSTLDEDRSVLDLLRANYTFVNERLARHYGIPGIYGSRFRRVTLPRSISVADSSATDRYWRRRRTRTGRRRCSGASGCSTTSSARRRRRRRPASTRRWRSRQAGALPPTIRERLAQHRRNPTCASCHAVIDPLGFTLENFDAIGGWRTIDEAGKPVDASGNTVSGAKVEGLSGLRSLLLAQPGQFPSTLTEKLLAYALGRRLEYYDRPAVRRIVRDAAADDYRWSSLVMGIVKSPAFLMRAPNVATN